MVRDAAYHLQGYNQIHNLKMLDKGAVTQAHLDTVLSKDPYNSAAAQKAREQQSKASKHRIRVGVTVSSSGLSQVRSLRKIIRYQGEVEAAQDMAHSDDGVG
ncbi:hypothetical protein GB937_010389 [Aspergillus fischeri]|nr:hypothetical protein GB937_010389 [Aspergillus fischeri]